MKRKYIPILFLLLTSSLIAFGAKEEIVIRENPYDYAIENGSATITGYNGTDTHIVIPEHLEGVPVSAIGESAFRNDFDIIEVVIPNTVVKIERFAFSNCKSLETVNIPSSVISIGIRAFSGCESLESITIPNSVTRIEAGAFSQCYSLLSINIPNEVSVIEESVFSSCKSLTEVIIPHTVTTISEDAFRNCESIQILHIPNSVTSIAERAFIGLSNLKRIVIPNSITTIEMSTFEYCTSLTEVILPSTITDIDRRAFYGCHNLQTINLENKTSIADNAFGLCYDLENFNEKYLPLLVVAENAKGEGVVDIGSFYVDITKEHSGIVFYVPYIKPEEINKIPDGQVRGLIIRELIADGKRIRPKDPIWDAGAYDDYLDEIVVPELEDRFLLGLYWDVFDDSISLHLYLRDRINGLDFSPHRYNIPYGSKDVYMTYSIRYPPFWEENETLDKAREETYTVKFALSWTGMEKK